MATQITLHGKLLYEVRSEGGKGRKQEYALYRNYTIEPYEGQVKWMTERIWRHAPKKEVEALALILNELHDDAHYINGNAQTHALKIIRMIAQAAESNNSCCDRGFFKKI